MWGWLRSWNSRKINSNIDSNSNQIKSKWPTLTDNALFFTTTTCNTGISISISVINRDNFVIVIVIATLALVCRFIRRLLDRSLNSGFWTSLAGSLNDGTWTSFTRSLNGGTWTSYTRTWNCGTRGSLDRSLNGGIWTTFARWCLNIRTWTTTLRIKILLILRCRLRRLRHLVWCSSLVTSFRSDACNKQYNIQYVEYSTICLLAVEKYQL